MSEVGDVVIDGETEFDDMLVAARIAQVGRKFLEGAPAHGRIAYGLCPFSQLESHRLEQTMAQGTSQKLAHLLRCA